MRSVVKLVRLFRQRGLKNGLRRLKRHLNYRIYCIRNREGEYITKQVEGRKMFLRPDDTGISLELALAGTREREHTDKIRDALDSGDTVLEIGANIGYFALIESEEIGENGIIYAVEPVPDNIELLEKNLKENNVSNCEVSQLAISDHTGKSELNIASNSNTHTMSEPYYEPEDVVEVNTVTGDEFLEGKKFPDLIRMDVEGHEFEILKGLEKTLDSSESMKVYLEIHRGIRGNEKVVELFDYMRSKGFDSDKSIEDCMENNASHVHFYKD